MGLLPDTAGLPFRVLLVDDDQQLAALLGDALSGPGVSFHSAPDGRSGCEAALQLKPHLILLDLGLPDADGLVVLDRLLSQDPNQDVIVFSGLHSNQKAVEAIQRGASDYITKPASLQQLTARIWERAQTHTPIEPSVVAGDDFGDFREKEGIMGRSAALLAVLAKIERIGPHFRTALISGETGTGKDLVARALHRKSQAAGPFVVCNCAAIAESLFESELFGYQKGAFTGASQDKIGLVEHAHGGTLFLDEVGELPLTTQAKLLRVLQTREVQRIGSATPRPVELRVIGATNRTLRTMVADRRFREDLYFRLAMLEISMPKLTERLEDLVLLENHFLDKCAKLYGTPRQRLSRRVQALLAKHSWPGNIRELENIIAYCCMMSRNETINPADLPEYLQRSPELPAAAPGQSLTMHEMRLKYVNAVLERVDGNRTRAAHILKIGRSTLYRYLNFPEAQ